jgi:hypothetical protein|tara:strand:- start:535 stop:1029 length:495 start_codon:yes stop_codon:yes gene_type:complete
VEGEGLGVSDADSTALKARIDTIEGGYELFLSYAAKGYRGGDPQTGGDLRRSIEEMDKALDGLGAFLSSLARERALEPIAPYDAFFDVIDGDAGRARKALQLVLAQPGISSQVIDNLNGSIHLRAVLTDLFLIDEILRPRASESVPAAALAHEEPPPPDTTSTS